MEQKRRNSFLSEVFKTGRICVDSYENKVISGRIWYPHFEKEEKFDNLMQFLMCIEQAMANLGFPGVHYDSRFFESTDIPETVEEFAAPKSEKNEPGKLATFAVKIIFQQNTSWQGITTWMEQGEEASFRSTLELIKIMDSALIYALEEN